MVNYNFWNQWTILILTWFVSAYAVSQGIVEYLLAVDKTYISFIIFGLFNISALAANYFTYFKKIPAWAARQLDFISAHITSLGMTGTVFGLIFIIQDGIPEPQQLLIGIGTALTTTLAGLIATILLNQILTIMDGVCAEE